MSFLPFWESKESVKEDTSSNEAVSVSIIEEPITFRFLLFLNNTCGFLGRKLRRVGGSNLWWKSSNNGSLYVVYVDKGIPLIVIAYCNVSFKIVLFKLML